MVPTTFRRWNCGQHIFIHMLNHGLKLHPTILRHNFQNLIGRQQPPLADPLQRRMSLHRRFLLARGHIFQTDHPGGLQEFEHVGFVGDHSFRKNIA